MMKIHNYDNIKFIKWMETISNDESINIESTVRPRTELVYPIDLSLIQYLIHINWPV